MSGASEGPDWPLNAGTAANQDTTIGRDECFIANLSIELIYHIIDFIPPESHLDFACTCKKFASYSSKVLKRHQEAYSRYRVASDLSPTTVPTLLRSIFGRADPLLAWHVRTIEVWYERTNWTEWKELRFDQVLHEDDMDVDCTAWQWQDDELDEYLEDLEGQFDGLVEGGEDEIRMEARQQFEDGRDGILKMLLIAYCPRLRSVKFVTHDDHEKSTLGWLKKLIEGSIVYGSHWPPGISNVQEVAVGVESDTWMSNIPELSGSDATHLEIPLQIFSSLLRLPRLDTIYYNGLHRGDDNDDTDFDTDTLMPNKSSTVKHIYLDDCGDLFYNFRNALCEAPVALESFALRATTHGETLDDFDSVASGLCLAQSASLHTFILYGPHDGRSVHGYRCSCYRPEELQRARNLKTVAIDASDVDLDCMYSCDGRDGQMTEDEQRRFFVKWFRETAFPSTIERLIFWGAIDYHFMERSKGKFLEWLEEALISVIQSRQEAEMQSSGEDDQESEDNRGPFHPNLQAVYLEEVERQYKPSIDEDSEFFTNKLHFQKLIEVGKAAGIDIHTLTNRAPPKHTHNFPTAPDKYDLLSGPWWNRREEIKDWVFDVYKGRRVPPA